MSEKDLESLGWNELVAHKRKLAGELKEITDKIIDIDRNQFRSINDNIKEQRSFLEAHTERIKQLRSQVDKHNTDLLSVSEKLSQSKNFLSMMEARIPTDKEEYLQSVVQKNQTLLDSKAYGSEQERGQILSQIKDATMKLEAIKATRTIRDQFSQLSTESANINNAIKQLNEERNSLRSEITRINSILDNLYDSKRKLASDHQSYLAQYNLITKQFDAINARLDTMSQMRRKQRKEYGYIPQNDALFKVKQEAEKKLRSGSKLSFDELKLLYGEKD
ncbi:MAG: hypothetical protein M3258_08650 [Thermoproteota archaeon]|nr:hypothetical protein [Thermoproteota archaeon]